MKLTNSPKKYSTASDYLAQHRDTNLPKKYSTAYRLLGTPILTRFFSLLLFLISTTAYAGSYTWNGATSTNWATSSNWSPAGVPSTNDTVTLSNGGVNSILLDGNRTITRLVISANTINLNTYELHISGRSSLNGGAINNGNLKIRGTYVYFQGTNFNCILDVIAGQIKFSGGTFDKTGSFEQNGSASGWGLGGCIFNDDVTIKNTGTVYLRMGQDAGDTFNGKVYLYSSGNYSLQMAYGDTSYFNDTIYVNSTGSGGINFANGTYGASILSDSACLITGNSGISAGTIQFKNIVQSATSSNSITASGSVLFNVYSNNFLGKVNFTAPNLVVKSTTFGDSTSLTKTGHTLNNTWDGANVYNGVVTITNGNTSTAYVKLASQNADTYNKDVYFNANSGAIQAANAGTNIYNGNVIVNGNNVTFNTSGGTLKFAGEQNQEFGGGTSTLNFNKLIVDKAGGSVTLNQPITIDSLLQLTSGILYTDTLITLKATATSTGASNLSFVDGTVKKIGNTAFVFPVGDDGNYYPLEISAPSSITDAFSAIYMNEFHNESDSSDTTLTYISTCQFWDIKRIVGTSNVSVKLYWDSLGCGVFDTVGLAVASWNGTKWIDKGRSSISGSAYYGSLWSLSTLTNYSKITLARDQPIITLVPTLINAKERSIPEDIFGYNGNNTISSDDDGDPLQSWEVLNSWDNNTANTKKFFSDKQVTLLRIPAGTLSNFSDWRYNYPLLEDDLPTNWFYKYTSYNYPMKRTGNNYGFIKMNLEKMAARPILAINMLTSTYFHELASFYSLNENNLPLRYVELGNEFYLNDEFYKDIFPSVNDYMDKALLWSNDMKNIPAFQNTQIAVLGAISNDNDNGRRREWLNQVLERLKVTNNVDAITLHDYINLPPGNTPCAGSLVASGIESFLLQSFVHITDLQAKEFLKIQQFNAIYAPKEIWITEFNLDDDNDKRTGTWAHGLLNAALALKYLETPEITKIITHTMLSGAKFGNIFESENAFDEISCHGDYSGKPTRKAEKSALGTALDGVASVLRHATKGTPLDFSGAGPLGSNNNYDEVYGWTFEDSNGYLKTIVLNMSGIPYNILISSIYPNLTSFNLNATVISAYNQSRVILGDGPDAGMQTYEDLEINDNPWIGFPSSSINIPPFSLLIIDQDASANPIRHSRLTDDEICSGSSTTLVVESNEDLTNDLPVCIGCSLSINLVENIGNRWIYSVAAGSVTTTQIHTINPCAACDPIDITIHQDISNLVLSATATDFCPSTTPSTPITLSASFDEGAGGDNNLSYSLLWTPDSGIVYSPCSDSPMCWSIKVEPERTTTYGIYVTDGHCWKSAEVEIKVPVARFTLGEDITICTNTTINVKSNYIDTDLNTQVSYLWSDASTSEVLQITPSTSGTFEYILTVTDDNCSREDTIIVNVISCCNPGTSVHVSPIEILNPNSSRNEYFNHADNLAMAITSSNCSGCSVTFSPSSGNQDKVEINGGTGNNSIFIDGEFRITNDINDLSVQGLEVDGMDLTLKNFTINIGEKAWFNVAGGRKLIFENCKLASCNNVMWRGIVLDQKGDSKSPEIEFKGTNLVENAETAVYLTREAIYNIDDVVFNNCYIDIEVVNHKGSAGSNSITGCTFQSSGAGLIAPYLGDRKFAGIVLDDVNLINIGISGGNTNVFTGSTYGIKSKNSSIKLLNSEFHDIWDDASIPTTGMCIYSESDFDFSDRSIQIGNGSSNGLNNFQRAFNGVYSVGEMNFDIRRNLFGNVANEPIDRIRGYCIYIDDNGPKNLNISGSTSTPNEFNNYLYGIYISRPNSFGIQTIIGNKFGAGHFSDDRHFEGTAINMVALGLTALKNAEISDNIIGEPITTTPSVVFPPLQPRIGIHLSSIALARVLNNSISFYHSTTPADNNRGIWSENSRDLEISGNTIENISSANGSDDLFVGMRINQSPGSCIENNAITNFGHGMSFFGQSFVYSLFSNTITDFDIGINLSNANIGLTVGTEDNQNPGNGNVMGNVWNLCNGCTATTKIDGSLASAVLTWYTNVSSGNTFPDNNVTGIIVDNISAGTPLSECPMPFQYLEDEDPPITLRVRNDLFGGVVADTVRYTAEFENEFRYESKQVVYDVLKNHPTLLDMNDESDDAFVEFYSDMLSSNIKKIDSLEVLINQKQFELAHTLLNEFVDTNTIEYNYKFVFTYYIKLMLWGEDSLDDGDSEELLTIANENPILGGKSIYMARTILNLEVNDEPLSSSSRLMQSKKTQKEITLNIYPNPSNNIVNVLLSNSSIAEEIQLSDITGRVCSKLSDANQMSTSQFLPGVYFLRVKYESYTWYERLIIHR